MNRKIVTGIVVGALLLGAGLASAQAFGRRGAQGQLRGQSGPVEIAIYAADPETGAEPIETLVLDRPLTPAEIVANYDSAAFVVVTGETFSRTVELSELEVEIAVYAEDPAGGAEPVATLAAMHPLNLREVLADFDEASFVVVTGSDFTRTLDLEAMAEARQRFEDRRGEPGSRDGRGRHGPGRFGPGGFGPSGFGPGSGPSDPTPGDGA